MSTSESPIRSTLLLAALVAGSAALAGPIRAQEGGIDTTFIRALEWRSVGPDRGGRSQAVAGSAERPLEYYFGATGGGLWKTVDAGANWRPVSDDAFESASVGAVAVCPANPDIVYVGMGETQLRGNIQQGNGVYVSTDAGESWEHAGLAETQAIARIRIHPWNCDRAYVAALGHPYGANPERGVYRTTDGGDSWEKILHRNERVGAVDLDLDPDDPSVIYAGFWEVNRTPWGLYSGGDGSGLFKSTDGGDSWVEITHNEGLPEDPIGKIGVSASPGSDRVYAIVEAEEGGVFRSEDGGTTWERVNDERRLRQRAFYYTRIYADPVDPDRVYVLNTGFYRSTDAGETYSRIRVPHGDNHDLWIAPDDPERMIESNDGGANVSFNGGRTWTEQDYPTAQFYHVTTTSHFPYHICGAQQDNSTACVPSRDWRHLGRPVGGFDEYLYSVGGGESGYIAPHPEDPDIFYAGSYGGYLSRYDHETGESRNIQVWPVNPMGHSSEDIRERFQWTFPIVFSPHDPDVLYVGSQHVWRTTDEGQSWERISPDLSRADPKTMGPSGGPITKDQTGVETYATVFTIAPSPHDPGVIWAGSDDGLVHLTRDRGESWTEVTPDDLPDFTRISLIAASPHTPGKAYLAGNRYQLDDRAPYVYRTDDYGESWTEITRGISDGHFARAVREDPERPGLLYAGTEHGAYISFDDGGLWQPLDHGMPDVQISDLVVEDGDLVVGTHGRSFYVLDGLDLYRGLTPDVMTADIHLFAPPDVYRDLDRGVRVRYSLREAADTVRLEFADAGGEVVRAFTGFAIDTAETGGEGDDEEEIDTDTIPPVDAGVNTFRWNLRHPGPTTFDDMIFWAAPTSIGPVVPPGEYTARLTVGDRTVERTFEVKLDPRLEGVTVAEVREQYELAKRIWRTTSRANEAVIRIRAVEDRIEDRIDAAGEEGGVRSVGRSILDQLDEVENAIYQTRLESNQDPLNFPIKLNNKIAYLLRVVESTPEEPTEPTHDAFEHLSGRLESRLSELEAILSEAVPAFNRDLEAAGMEPVEIPPPEGAGM